MQKSFKKYRETTINYDWNKRGKYEIRQIEFLLLISVFFFLILRIFKLKRATPGRTAGKI